MFRVLGLQPPHVACRPDAPNPLSIALGSTPDGAAIVVPLAMRVPALGVDAVRVSTPSALAS